MEDKYVTWAALAVSICALGSSMESCSVSREALKIQHEQYISQSKTIWEATINEENNAVAITPSNKKVSLLRAKIHYPTEISDTDWPIEPPEYRFYLTTPFYNLKEMLEAKIPKEKHHVALYISSIPVIIESYYTINGESHYEKALYSLEYSAYISDKEWEQPSITVKGLLFVKRLSQEIKPREYLDNLADN